MKYKPSQYAKALYEMTKEKDKNEISGAVNSFANFLKKNNDFHLMGKVISEFSNLYNKKEGIVEAEVVSRGEISNKENILDFIKKEFGGENRENIKANYKKDEKIKGGLIIKTKDHIIDASLSAQITKLKKHLS